MNRPKTVDELKNNIHDTIAKVDTEMLNKVESGKLEISTLPMY